MNLHIFPSAVAVNKTYNERNAKHPISPVKFWHAGVTKKTELCIWSNRKVWFLKGRNKEYWMFANMLLSLSFMFHYKNYLSFWIQLHVFERCLFYYWNIEKANKYFWTLFISVTKVYGCVEILTNLCFQTVK